MDLENPPTPDPTAHSRRRFMQATGGITALAVMGSTQAEAEPRDDQGRFESNPFSLGVASGDPLPNSVVLWTRLAPNPYKPDGGMPEQKVPVHWTISRNEDLNPVAQTGTTFAEPEHVHTIHNVVEDLEPNTEYYYQFEADGQRSPVGRTKTAPAPDSSVDEFSFAFASCQAWYDGFYTPYRYMAKDELDLIIHLGDYIYEYGIGPNGGVRNTSVPQDYRAEPMTLDRYRQQYGLYKSDPDLQAAHASAPWLVTRDDHEVDNNWADELAQDPDEQTVQQFLQRRAAAFKAYYEHMPFRPAQKPDGPDQKLYRNYTFGDLVEFNVLDTRLYRSDQACGGGFSLTECEERFAEDRTLLGGRQEEWLVDNLEHSVATWDIVANQVPFAKMDFERRAEEGYRMDQWDGYVADQRTVKSAFEDHVENPVVVTGDFHSNWANTIKSARDESEVIGTEFVGTSITSGGDGSESDEFGKRVVRENENVKYYNNRRGYVRCTVTPDQWQTDFRVVKYVTRQDSPSWVDERFVVEEGTPGLQKS